MNSECCVQVSLDRTSHLVDPVIDQAKEAEEELRTEDKSDPMETLTTMVTGCENFVTTAIARDTGRRSPAVREEGL